MDSRDNPEHTDCFLCSPDPRLVFAETADFFALCGLGPLMPGYSLVAARAHVRSTADIPKAQQKSFTTFLLDVRQKLAGRFGSCIAAEHGRMPVCLNTVGLSETHCYHAHMLLFPGSPPIDRLAIRFFDETHLFENLEQALEQAQARQEEYYLLSSHPQLFALMLGPRHTVRQFSRALVAQSLGKPELTSWQEHPNEELALAYAQMLRPLFPSHGKPG